MSIKPQKCLCKEGITPHYYMFIQNVSWIFHIIKQNSTVYSKIKSVQCFHTITINMLLLNVFSLMTSSSQVRTDLYLNPYILFSHLLSGSGSDMVFVGCAQTNFCLPSVGCMCWWLTTTPVFLKLQRPQCTTAQAPTFILKKVSADLSGL